MHPVRRISPPSTRVHSCSHRLALHIKLAHPAGRQPKTHEPWWAHLTSVHRRTQIVLKPLPARKAVLRCIRHRPSHTAHRHILTHTLHLVILSTPSQPKLTHVRQPLPRHIQHRLLPRTYVRYTIILSIVQSTLSPTRTDPLPRARRTPKHVPAPVTPTLNNSVRKLVALTVKQIVLPKPPPSVRVVHTRNTVARAVPPARRQIRVYRARQTRHSPAKVLEVSTKTLPTCPTWLLHTLRPGLTRTTLL
mmetsp:Transcript_2205/g.5012  ORF Transcript_2205/g.5012 Transcript_2205/m.5012 type:complete len:248 (-) Transcript_2205:54-797(-)